MVAGASEPVENRDDMYRVPLTKGLLGRYAQGPRVSPTPCPVVCHWPSVQLTTGHRTLNGTGESMQLYDSVIGLDPVPMSGGPSTHMPTGPRMMLWLTSTPVVYAIFSPIALPSRTLSWNVPTARFDSARIPQPLLIRRLLVTVTRVPA